MSDGAKYEQLVRDFCDAWADGDHDKVVEYFTADGVYHNIPVDPMVVTERVDIFEKEDGGEIELPVLGIFEFEGDKIAKWREYFDLNQFMSQMG